MATAKATDKKPAAKPAVKKEAEIKAFDINKELGGDDSQSKDLPNNDKSALELLNSIMEKEEAENKKLSLVTSTPEFKTAKMGTLLPGQGRCYDTAHKKYVLDQEQVIASMIKFNGNRFKRA